MCIRDSLCGLRAPIGGPDLLVDGSGPNCRRRCGGRAGWAVAADADMTGDGCVDVWMTAPGNGQAASNAGAAAVFYGPVSGALTFGNGDFRVFGEATEDAVGDAISAAGDLNGDSVADMVVGSANNDRGATSGGTVYVVFGTGL